MGVLFSLSSYGLTVDDGSSVTLQEGNNILTGTTMYDFS